MLLKYSENIEDIIKRFMKRQTSFLQQHKFLQFKHLHLSQTKTTKNHIFLLRNI